MLEPYSVAPPWGSRAYSDIHSHVYFNWVYTTGRFTGTNCELSRWVYLEFGKSITIVLCIRVHFNGQFMHHVLSGEVYPVLGFSFISGFYFHFFFWGAFKTNLLHISFMAFMLYFHLISFLSCFLPVNLFTSRNRFECYVAWYMTVVCVCVLLFLMAKAVGKCSEHLDNCTLAKYTWYYVNAPMWGNMVSGIYVCLWGSAEALELLLWPGGDSLGDGHESEAFSPSDARLRRYGRFKIWYLTPKNMVTFRIIFGCSNTYWLLSTRVALYWYASGCQGSGDLCFGPNFLSWNRWIVKGLGGLKVFTEWYWAVGFWGLFTHPQILWLLISLVAWKWYGSIQYGWESHCLWDHWIGNAVRIEIMYPGKVGTHFKLVITVWEQASPVLFSPTCYGVVLNGTGMYRFVKVFLGSSFEFSFSTVSSVHQNFLSLGKLLWEGGTLLQILFENSGRGTQGLIVNLGFPVGETHRMLFTQVGVMLHSWMPCCVHPCGFSLLRYAGNILLLYRKLRWIKIVDEVNRSLKSAAVRSPGVRFPSYGHFKVLQCPGLEYCRVMGSPPGIERLYDRLPWLVHDCCYKMHWGKVVLPLMVKFLHWIRCKWKI